MHSERRSLVLDLVADAYIASARPVASAPVARQLGVSSATVRNDFAALEEQGYLLQPHTSAGRVPSPLGFEVYAQKFIPPGDLSGQQQGFVDAQLAGQHGEALLQSVARVTAALSGYAVVASLPLPESLQILGVHLSSLSSTRVLVVLVLEHGLIRQRVLELGLSLPEDVLREAETVLRGLGLPLGELAAALEYTARQVSDDLAEVLLKLADALPELWPTRIYSEGLSNVLSEPESADPDFVRRVVRSVEAPGLKPLPASESAFSLELDEALARVVSRFKVGSVPATLLLVGPTRMRYSSSLRTLGGVARSVSTQAESLWQN